MGLLCFVDCRVFREDFSTAKHTLIDLCRSESRVTQVWESRCGMYIYFLKWMKWRNSHLLLHCTIEFMTNIWCFCLWILLFSTTLFLPPKGSSKAASWHSRSGVWVSKPTHFPDHGDVWSASLMGTHTSQSPREGFPIMPGGDYQVLDCINLAWTSCQG